jgi:hypothetical protein
LVGVDLVYGYPAIMIGLVAGLVAAWRRRPISPILLAGAITFAALVLHESTVPRLASPEGNGTYTPAVWAMFALVNVGSWALGIAMGVAVVGVSRRDVRV